MSPRNLFRSIVALSLVLSLLSTVSAQLATHISEDWQTVLEWNGQGGILEYLKGNLPQGTAARIALLLLLSSIVAYVVAVQIGMFLFWPFARFGYALLTAGFIVFAAFDGLYVATPWDSAIGGLALVLDGVIIAASYLQPIGAYFFRPHV